MKKSAALKTATCAERIVVDYPPEGEALPAPRCLFQIDAPARSVEIAVDGEDWRPCSRRDERWWYDWSGSASGRHQALVRCEAATGGEHIVRTCRFSVQAAVPEGSAQGGARLGR